ncbi:MAG: nicotinamide riboside transporter PnuC [Candidatus Nanopelagicaceae bacterium]
MDISLFRSFFDHVLFTAWEYDVTILEAMAAITALIAVYLGTTGKRIMWPWWVVSSALYAIWFFQYEYYASVATQFIFIGFGIWGWFGWGPNGADPSSIPWRYRAIGLAVFALAWIAFTPYLQSVGAVYIWSDTLGLLGSAFAQFAMVKEKWENWAIWFVVDIVLTVQYWLGGSYFTSIIYLIFTGIALLGLARWYRRAEDATNSPSASI